MSTAIEFEHVGKQYRLGLVSTKTLSHDLHRWWQTAVLNKEDPYLKIGEVNDRSTKGSSEYVWALRDIDFKVEQGDVVGIIGKNGAGKSTLLKLLSKVTGPTVGTIRARGRIGSLLEVGTGFHPEMTGRENIYMNGAIMGMSKAEISRKLDEIIDFSGCERYIDTPVKRYSSGMTVRLGFAVAAHLDPEILVVDEVLAVGDAEFQKKAIGKMQDVSQSEGRTVLFVSHNMASIGSLCKSCVILENGSIKYIGQTDDAISLYRKSNASYSIREFDFKSFDRLKKDILISDFYLTNDKGERTNIFGFDDRLHFICSIKSSKKASISLRVTIFNMDEVRVLAFDTSDIGKVFPIVSGADEVTLEGMMMEPLNIKPGNYRVNVSIRQGAILLDHVIAATTFEVKESDFYGDGRFHLSDMALCLKHHEWRIR